MSRLTIFTKDRARSTVESLYKDMERRIVASQPGLCPVDLAASFLKMCRAQSCGKCVPCRVGLAQMEKLLEDVLNGDATEETLAVIEKTARTVFLTADCPIGYEAARMVLRGLEGFRNDFEEHIRRGRCICSLDQPVPCVSMCPARVDIPGYIACVLEGRYADAVRLIRKDNPMPAVCGLICEHPCEIQCRRSMMDDPVNIRGLKRFAVSRAGEVPLPKCAELTGKHVAIIGGGPGGLSAAYYLRLMGHEVTIFEQRKQFGGMLRYGIPRYRLPREVLQAEIDTILSLGIHTKTEVSVGENPSVMDLHRDYDAVYIAIGAHTDRKVGIEGEDATGVISAVQMLRDIGDNRLPDFTGKRVCVIGGGNVSMDVARSAVRLGAASVKVVYRRRKIDMTAQAAEVEGAIAEGCEILELQKPVRVEKDENGCVAALMAKPQIVGPIQKGRPVPADSAEPEVRIPCDYVLVAIGQGIQAQPFEKDGIPVKRGVIDAMNWSGIRNIPGVFAGGDCVTGPATVIRAIAAGKVAAANIDEYLGFNHVISCDVEIPPVHFDEKIQRGRINMRERPAGERKNDFLLIECGMTAEEAKTEAGRCLRCDKFGYGIFKGGRQREW